MLSNLSNVLKNDIRPNKDNVQVIPLPRDSENINPKSRSLILYDLETTGFGNEPEILQISAVYEEEEFSVYTKPKHGIPLGATEVNKLSLNSNNKLCYNGIVVDSVQLSEGLNMFVKWLKKVPSSRVLMGHNIRTYDTRILMKALSNHKMTLKFCRLIDGCVDTYTVFQRLVPKKEDEFYKQKSLVFHYLNESYEAHNALEDARILQKLILHVKMPEKLIPIDYIELSYFTRKSSYKDMILRKGISDSMARKFSQNKISYNDLLSQYRIGGDATLKGYLHQIKDGKVLGTKDRRAVSKIVKYLKARYNM